MKYKNFVDDAEERCWQCGCEEFHLNPDTTLYHCVKCASPMDEPEVFKAPKEKVVRKFKDRKAA